MWQNIYIRDRNTVGYNSASMKSGSFDSMRFREAYKNIDVCFGLLEKAPYSVREGKFLNSLSILNSIKSPSPLKEYRERSLPCILSELLLYEITTETHVLDIHFQILN